MTSISRVRPVVLKGTSQTENIILREYAEFWKIPHQLGSENNDLPVFSTGTLDTSLKCENNPVIITPSITSAENIAEANGLQLTNRTTQLTIQVGPGVQASIDSQIHEFAGTALEPILKSADTVLLSRLKGTDTYLLSLDLIAEYSQRLHGGVRENPNWKFRFATRLPFSYQAIPRFVRDRSFRSSKGPDLLTEANLAPVEFLRTLFLASIVLVAGPIPRIKFWKRGKSYALTVTHDVETQYGLETGALQLLRVERQLELSSTWNVPSDRYPISPRPLQMIGDAGEIGGHDTRHDGKLIFLTPDELVQRLTECKTRLEQLSEKRVRGFRAPLLQHSAELMSAESMAGFDYDSSCPSWEILSPTSLRPHGVGTLFPFEMNGTLEIPVSLPQDHQLIRVAGQTPTEAVDLWLRLAQWIRGLGGPCVLLVHPDYELGLEENSAEYRRLLKNFVADNMCHIMTLGQLSDWWRYRARARWDMTDDQVTLVRPDQKVEGMELEAELVTGYASNGFRTEALA
jgi:hypothetical protein